MKAKASMFFVVSFFSLGFVATGTFGQVNNIVVSNDRVVIDVADPRPLSAALQVFLNAYTVDITYEDVRFTHEADIADLTLQVRKDLHLYSSPDAAPRVLAPRMSSLSMDLPMNTMSPTPEEVLAAIKLIVRNYESSVGRGTYRVTESSGVVHVVPIASRRDDSLIPSAQESILDTRISIPRQELDGSTMFSVICEAVSLAAGGVYDPLQLYDTPLKPRRIPDSMLSRYVGILEAENEPARDVFMRVLKAADETSVWLLFATFDPTYDNYWVSARGLARNPANESPQAESRSQPSEIGTERSGFVLGDERLKALFPDRETE